LSPEEKLEVAVTQRAEGDGKSGALRRTQDDLRDDANGTATMDYDAVLWSLMIATQQSSQPVEPVVLTTERLMLRRWRPGDMPAMLPLIGAREVAATTLRIPHPYTPDDAEKFMQYCDGVWEKGDGARFAVLLRDGERLIGGVGLVVNREHQHGELGYWIGVPFWGIGYCTEAVRALLKHGFRDLNLNRIYATHFANNPASGRVMQKLGMKHEGIMRQHICKWGDFLDVETYGILRKDWK
jgi:RimJ/RimL family protein N-acetyltransferase